ncbi:hypothetical protein B0I35DRAFT_481669 [Stachybotrys elegans]|uniref:Peroxisomal membrane protein PEX14 n=1 Tax=Stachybotrys elegans TaxID=80388 RepID=A0A8K0SLM9_9HYPO|nr:hypothetical protein B0I35DRAFT_481669 [Stachybotrys elegans]
MSDPEDKPSPPEIPAWQREQGESTEASLPSSSSSSSSSDGDVDVETARRFLDHEDVRGVPRQKKIDFLLSKGISESQAQSLVDEVEPSEKEDVEPADKPEAAPAIAEHQQTPEPDATLTDRPPIVTYPEFLSKPQSTPPLVTTSRLLGVLNAFAAVSAAIYGTSKFVVTPMVESLTEAREDLHDTTARKLDALVAKLEQTVSEIPPRKQNQADAAPEASADEDPAEMFHRDIGTQTSVTPPPKIGGLNFKSESERQINRILTLTTSVRQLKDGCRMQSEDAQEIKTTLDVFRDELDALAYSRHSEFVGGYDMFYNRNRKEPEDEIRKVRDNIRRVKGVLLSARSFPSSTAR